MLILASQSPRRRELLAKLNIPFQVEVADVDEHPLPEESPRQLVARLSRLKAEASAGPGKVVIAADTVVVQDEKILGKPADEQEAKAMLMALSGRTHQVMTGVTVLKDGKAATHTEITQVTFRTLTEGEISRYIAGGEPMDKAGAYGIQGGAGVFVEAICGDYYNVVGLPRCRLWRLLGQVAPELLEDPQ